MADPAAIALSELNRRRANAQALVSQNRLDKRTAEAAVARWCGIAAWFGAVLPDELRPYEDHQTWFDHAPRGTGLKDWLRELAQRLRTDTLAALAKSEADHPEEAQRAVSKDRARALLALDRQLSLAAGLPPIGAEPVTPAQAGAQSERKAA